jgi:hypothetical protein
VRHRRTPDASSVLLAMLLAVFLIEVIALLHMYVAMKGE